MTHHFNIKTNKKELTKAEFLALVSPGKRIPEKKKESKYKNKKIDTPDGTFDSQKEYQRWVTLQLLQSKGLIQGLQRQVTYVLIPSYKDINQRSVKYIADFIYYENGKRIVEDVKSAITRTHPLYIVKKKLLYHLYKIIIKET
jgi:hypothetical protein